MHSLLATISLEAWCYGSRDITKIMLQTLCHVSKTAVKKGGSYHCEHTDFIPHAPPPPLPHSSASNMGDETDDDEYADYDDEEEEYAQMQQTMLLNMSTLVQLWESVRNQEEGSPVKQSRIPCPFAPHLSWDLFIAQQQQQDPRDFIKCLRMSIEAFEHLHSLLEVKLQKNKSMGDLQGGLISSRLQLYLTI